MTSRAKFEIADTAYKAAFWKWKEAQRAYHALEIGDAEYFPIKDEFDAALAAVEAAEAELVETEETGDREEQDNEDTQLELL